MPSPFPPRSWRESVRRPWLDATALTTVSSREVLGQPSGHERTRLEKEVADAVIALIVGGKREVRDGLGHPRPLRVRDDGVPAAVHDQGGADDARGSLQRHFQGTLPRLLVAVRMRAGAERGPEQGRKVIPESTQVEGAGESDSRRQPALVGGG